ncbi:MAG: hypothetical protein MHPSP_002563, partial [Paramarteilia canceri]
VILDLILTNFTGIMLAKFIMKLLSIKEVDYGFLDNFLVNIKGYFFGKRKQLIFASLRK